MTTHVREDEAASDSDFEWVNAWAVAATAQKMPAVAAVDNPAATTVAPLDGSEGSDAEQVPQAHPAAVPLLETARRRKRWTHLFRVIARASETENLAERERSMPDASQDASSDRRAQDTGEGKCGDATLDLSQIKRDVAEIELVRDRLLSEVAPANRRIPPADRCASARTSDYVPILVGGVLALTSLVVFGAAALFVSLR
jgi:hypothetical protein